MSGDFVCNNTIKLPGEVNVFLYESKRNGLRVVIAQVPSPVINVNITIPTEAYSHEGEPHCLEHLIFRGSAKYPVAGYLDSLVALSLASGTNACTDTDKTYYTASMVGVEAFGRILPVYLDHIYHPVLNEADFRTEVYHMDGDKPNGVVYSEMETYMSDPNFIGEYKLHEVAYSDSSKYHYNTGGIPNDIIKLTNDKVKAMHSKLYKLNKSVLSVIGQITTEQALDVISQFEQKELDMELSPINNSETDDIIPKSSKIIEHYSAESSDEDIIVLLGFRCPNSWLDIEKRIGLEILLSYMTEGSSAPLVKWLIENPKGQNIASDLDVETHDYEHDLITFTFTDVLISDRKNQLLNRFKDVIQTLCNDDQDGLDMHKINSIIQREIRCEISDLQKQPHRTIEDRLTCWATMAGNNNDNAQFRDILCPDLVLKRLLQRNDKLFWTNLLRENFINNESYQVWMKPKVMKHKPIKNVPHNHPPHSSSRNNFAITDLERKRQLREMIKGVRGLELKCDMSALLPDAKCEGGLIRVPNVIFDQKGKSDFIEFNIMTDVPKSFSSMTMLMYLEQLIGENGNNKVDKEMMRLIEVVKENGGGGSKEFDESVVGSLKYVLRTFPVDLLIPILTYIMESPASVNLKRGDVHTEEILRLNEEIIRAEEEDGSDVVIDYVKWDKILTSYVLEFVVDEGIPGTGSSSGEGGISYPVYKAGVECGLAEFGHVLALMKGYLVGAEIDLDRIKVKVRKLISQLNSSIRTGESVVRCLNTLISFTTADNMSLNRDNIILLSILSRLVLAYPDLFLLIFRGMINTLHHDRLLASNEVICTLSIGNMASMQTEVFKQIQIYFPNLLVPPTAVAAVTSAVQPAHRRKDLPLPLDMYLKLPNLETGHLEWTSAFPIKQLLLLQDHQCADNQIYRHCELIEVITAYLQSEQGPIFQPVRDNGYSYCPTFYYDLDSQSITLRLFDCSQPHEALQCALNSLTDLLQAAKSYSSGDNNANSNGGLLTEQSFEVAKSSALHNIIGRYLMTSLKATNHAVNNWLRHLPLFRSVEIIEKINRLTWEDFLRGLVVILDHLLSETNKQLIGIFPSADEKTTTTATTAKLLNEVKYELLYDKIGDVLVQLTKYKDDDRSSSKNISKLLRMKTNRLCAGGDSESDDSDDDDDDEMSDDDD